MTETPTQPTSPPRRPGARLDRLAELEEEQRFLLRSLRDLEREHDAGDVDDADYETLRDGYTVRAATVIRQIESGKASLPPKGPRSWGRTVLVTAAVAAGAVAIGLGLASAFGERSAGQEITGLDPNDARSVLVSARAALNAGNFSLANAQFARAVQMERDDGVDNVEAITYFGWTLALETRMTPDADTSAQRLDAARIALRQAVALDPDYPDPNCFLAIVEFNFYGDAAAALPFAETCEQNDPPAEMRNLIESFVDDIRAEVG